MFVTIFASVIRCLAVPIVAFLALTPAFGEKPAFLIVAIALTVTNIISILWQCIKFLPNLMLLRGGHIIRSFVRIFIEIISIIGFWLYYLANYK